MTNSVDISDKAVRERIAKKSEFWWATIAGANCEPVEIVKIDGERAALTCGCADPFFIDRPDCRDDC